MAKPFSQLSGSGFHVHFSLNDSRDNNLFASPVNALNSMMRLCIAGQLARMPASVAILAPGVNAFRRLRKNLTEPLFHSGVITPVPPPCGSPARMTATVALSTVWPELMLIPIWWLQPS